MTYRIEHNPNPDPSDVERLRASLSRYNRSKIPDRGYLPVHLTLLDERNGLAGGLSGYVAYGWLFVDTLWIAETARSRGFGRELMQQAEEIARTHGAHYAWLDTFSFQARGFYEKLGYRVFAELEDFPPGHSRYFLRKEL